MVVLVGCVISYFLIGILMFYTMPYKNDVPFMDRFWFSLGWLPLIIWTNLRKK